MRTIRDFGAHQKLLWCAPFVLLVRTKAPNGVHQSLGRCAPERAEVRTLCAVLLPLHEVARGGKKAMRCAKKCEKGYKLAKICLFVDTPLHVMTDI